MNKVLIPRLGLLNAVCLQILNRFPYGKFVDAEIDCLEIVGNLESLQTNGGTTEDPFHVTFSVKSPSLKGTRLKVSFVLHWSSSRWLGIGEYRSVSFDHSDLKNLIRFVWLHGGGSDWRFTPFASNNMEETQYLRDLLAS